MENTYISPQYNASPLYCYINNYAPSERHWHKEVEIIYVLNGTLTIQIREKIYHLESDHVILINSYDIHSILNEDCELATFKLDLTFFQLSTVDINHLRFDCNSATSNHTSQFDLLKHLLAKIVHSFSSTEGYLEILTNSLAYELFYCLVNNYKVESVSKSENVQKYLNVIEPMIDYINDHYDQKLTLQLLAEKLFLTEPYLSKIFKQYIGCTFSEYLNSIRLSHALTEIKNNELSIEMIAERCGFPNSRSFTIAFNKKFGLLPSKFRKQYVANTYTDSTFRSSFYFLEHQNNFENLAKFLHLNHPKDLNTKKVPQLVEIAPISTQQEGFELRHTFLNTTSIGKAKHILFANNQDMLKQLQEDIGFKYIKFHGLLDDDMMVYSENEQGEPELNFSYIDMIFDFLLSINLKPFIQLGFMPHALAQTCERSVFYNHSIISLPKSMEKWTYLIKSLVLHLMSRYGASEVLSWPFSLWNIPDTPEYLFGFETPQDYFEFYKATFEAVKSCNPNIIFGGPSCMNHTMEEGTWITQFIRFCTVNDCKPEFLNLHFYPVDINVNIFKPSAQSHAQTVYRASSDALKESIYTILRNSKTHAWDVSKIYLTEWNASLSHRELLNDTAFKSCYIIKNILENYDRLESFGYWALSDFIEEVKMSNELYHGGIGLFTYNGIKKSAYYAFCLLKRLGSHLIGKGDGYFITKSNNRYQIIFYNYQHFSKLYAAGELFDMSFTNRYTPFVDDRYQKFVVPLSDISNQEYILTETIINKNHGSSFDKWIELGALPLETNEDIDYLKSVSIPQIKKRKLFVENNLLTIACELEPHEVRLVEITPVYS